MAFEHSFHALTILNRIVSFLLTFVAKHEVEVSQKGLELSLYIERILQVAQP